MPLQTATPTDLPRNADTTLNRPTWGESGGPFALPALTDSGYPANSALPSNDLNYKFQEPGRWARSAAIDRNVFSSEGLFTSCAVGPAVFNVGGGTLNITLKPVRIVVDYGPNPLAPAAPDGGVVLELFALGGSPEPLPANSDSYVDVAENGTVTVTSVPSGNPAPALALGFVRFYILETDGLELTTAELAPGVAPFPCLGPITGAANIQATEITAGAATVTDLSVPTGGSLEVENGASADLLGTVTLGTGPGDAIDVLGTLASELRAFAGVDIDSSEINGTAASKVGTGTLTMVIGAPIPSSDGEIAVNADGLPVFHSDGSPRFTQGSVVGALVEVEDDQVAVTGVAATTFVTTGQTFTGLVRIIVDGEVQRSVAGNVRIAIAENSSGGYLDIDNGGVTSVSRRAVDTSDASDWTPFHMERTVGVGLVATLARLDLQGSGSTARIRETHIKVRRLGV